MSRRPLPVHLSPRPVRTARTRLVRSSFADDLYRDRYFIAACTLILFCAFLVGVLTGHLYVGWDGVYPIPTQAPDGLTGTDAGLLPPDAGHPAP